VNWRPSGYEGDDALTEASLKVTSIESRVARTQGSDFAGVTLRVTLIRSTTPRHSNRGGAMPEPSSTGKRRPKGTTCSRTARGMPARVEGSVHVPLRLVRGTRDSDEEAPTGPGTEVILITEADLELPLVASPMQVARLKDGVRQVAFGDANKGLPMATPSSGQREGPPPIPTDQVLSRVRVVIRRSTRTEGDAS
jgi:hypothetical protein